MLFVRFLIAVELAAACSARAEACTPEPFLFQLPGESVEAAEARSSRILSDNAILRRADRENDAYMHAQNIYLARVIRTAEDAATRDRITTVRPMNVIRGAAPKVDQSLRDSSISGRCAPVGDGDIGYLPSGSYVVVFEGLPRDEYRPRGIDSFAVDSLRNGDLLEAVMKFGRDPEK